MEESFYYLLNDKIKPTEENYGEHIDRGPIPSNNRPKVKEKKETKIKVKQFIVVE